MKERPIHFKQPVADAQIRAILEGRKTQTRLVVKDVGPDNWLAGASNHVVHALDKCPYGQPGDRLWVRETFMGPLIEDVGDYPDGYWSPEFCEYRADGGAAPEWVDVDGETHQGWKPSIHMPRWASRITLEITAVRVERLQDISREDAIAEGARHFADLPGKNPWGQDRRWSMQDPDSVDQCLGSAQAAFANYFCLISGKPRGGSIDFTPWEANPWVWVIEFKRID